MTAPKVCIFTETYYPVVGGGETQAQLLAERLIALGFSVILLTRRSDAALKKVEQFGDLTVYRLPPVGRGQLKKWGLILSGLPALIKLRHQYDLIFVSGYRIVGITAVLLAKLLKKKVVLKADSQGEMSGEFFKNGLARIKIKHTSLPFRIFLGLRNKIIQRANGFVSISPEITDEMTSNGVNSKHIHSIPNSVDTKRFQPASARRKAELRHQLELPPDHLIAVYTGRLVSYKGLPLLLEVWNELWKNRSDITLLLLGKGGLDIHNCESELKEYVEAQGLQACVRFAGAVQNVPDYLQAADIFVFPTEDDALPSSLIEAMASCLPVIATPVGAIKSIIVNGRNGISIPPKDFQALFNALEKLFDNEGLRAELGNAGWETVRKRFSADIVSKQYAALFTNLIQPEQSPNCQDKCLLPEKQKLFLEENKE